MYLAASVAFSASARTSGESGDGDLLGERHRAEAPADRLQPGLGLAGGVDQAAQFGAADLLAAGEDQHRLVEAGIDQVFSNVAPCLPGGNIDEFANP